MPHLIPPGVVGVIVTHRRLAELERLLDSLAASMLPVLGCVISDHAPDGSTRQLASRYAFEVIVLEDATNPGPGAGWANAAAHAEQHFGERLTSYWFLDDDVVVPPQALAVLCDEMQKARALAIAPLLEDAEGKLWGFPEPEISDQRRLIRQAKTPRDALQLLGSSPQPFCWCTGACVLVERSAYKTVGPHRRDFWMLGEDLEFSMRLAATGTAVFTCKVAIPHLPPPAANARAAARGDYIKFCSLLQNLGYLATHSPHSRHMLRYLPGNFRRFFRTHGLRYRTVRDALACAWNGIVLAKPRGQTYRPQTGVL